MAQAPNIVGEHAREFFTAAHLVVGERFAEARFDPDRSLRVTVIDLNDQDITEITGLAQRLGVDGWVSIERADPAALEHWEQLRLALLTLRDTRPRTLRGYPAPDPGYRRPPVHIDLAADAEATAAELHTRFGDFVSLRVGALAYPPESTASSPSTPRTANINRKLVDPREMRVALDGPLVVRSGQVANHDLLVTNLSDQDISVRTNGHLTAGIVDPDTGVTVGGYAGAQQLPLVIFTARPAVVVRIPLLVGTASYNPDLGYTVPPGTWQLTAPMNLADGRHLVTPALELTISG